MFLLLRPLKKGRITDATLIAAPSSTKNREGERDPEMRQTKKRVPNREVYDTIGRATEVGTYQSQMVNISGIGFLPVSV